MSLLYQKLFHTLITYLRFCDGDLCNTVDIETECGDDGLDARQGQIYDYDHYYESEQESEYEPDYYEPDYITQYESQDYEYVTDFGDYQEPLPEIPKIQPGMLDY